jgi:hypothetical protein
MAVPRMLPSWVLCGLAFALGAAPALTARAQSIPPAEEANAPEANAEEPNPGDAKAEKPEPVYPVLEPELRLIGGVERHLEHPRSVQVGEHNRQPFFIEQGRIELDVKASKWLSGSFSAELTKDPVVRDAFVNARIKRWFQIQAGQFKRPMSRTELIGMSKLPFRERGIFNRALLRQAEWGNRALGAMLWGKLRKPDLEWNLAVTNSAESIGARRAEQIRGVDVLGRVEYEPVEWLAVAINGGYKNTEPYVNGPNLSLLAFGGDVRIRGGGFQMVLESIGAQNPRAPVPPDSRGRSPFALGINGYATYDIPLGNRVTLQPTVAGEWVDTDLDVSKDETVRGLGGVNLLLFDGAYRIMPQVDVVRPLGEVGARSQVKRETYYLMISAVL